MAYIDTDDLQLVYDYPDGDLTLLDALILIAQGIIENYTGRVFEAPDITVTVEGVLEQEDLPEGEGAAVGDITSPPTPSYLVVTGYPAEAGLNGIVKITGTDEADGPLTDIEFQLNEDASIIGTDLFKTVTGITLPAYDTAGDAICVGYQTDRTAQTRYYTDDDSDDTDLLLDTDLLTITSVKIDDVAVTDYKLLPRNDLPTWGLYRELGWSADEIEINGKWAYSATAPANIVQAALRLVSWLYKMRETSDDLDRPYLTPGGVIVMPSRLPTDIAMLLDPYKRVLLA